MFSNKLFRISIAVSLAIHGAVLSQNSSLRMILLQNREKQVEVKYIKEVKLKQAVKTKAETGTLRPQPSRREPLLQMPPKITADKRIPPPFIEKSTPSAPPAFLKPSFIKPESIAIKKRVSLPAMPALPDVNKINNPVYISYYQVVREKIKRAAYQNYTSTETGEVTVSFVVSDNGYLKDMRLVDEKSSSSLYLREIAIRSIKDASPFPNFPKELDYPQLSFNLAITFEVE